MKTILKLMIFLYGNLSLYFAQNISMEFPYFAGKTYVFVIFQGKQPKTVSEGTIPKDGKFNLNIPEEYAPYTGMSRWLITGTQEGGGLDMLIPGHDFSVSCVDKEPNNDNIIYTSNPGITEMNNLSNEQQGIFSRHDAMFQAVKAFPKTDKNYSLFEQAYQEQIKTYDNFQERLKKDKHYVAEFLRIVNITRGIGTKLEGSEEKNAFNIARYIADELDWQVLYTSGHWEGVISSWIDIYSQVLKNDKTFILDFAKIGDQLKNQDQYTDFAGKVVYFLTQKGRDHLINKLSPLIMNSGKINRYEGALEVYTHGATSFTAPDLLVSRDIDEEDKKITLKSSELAGKNYEKTLLVFYESGCGNCEQLLKDLQAEYEILQKKVRVIGISSDKDKIVFKNRIKDFPWSETYCDYEGFQGMNFRNFGVMGTPTLILIDRDGKVLARSAGLDEIFTYLGNTKKRNMLIE